MHIFFDILYLLAAIIYLPSFILKGKHRVGFKERLGIFKPGTIQAIKNANKHKPIIWVHAVSVGEIKAAAVLIDKLRNEFKNYTLLISTITPTGNQVSRQIAEKEDIIIYFPFDLSFIVEKVLALINPQALLVMETELWPNIIPAAAKRKTPVIIINGRISDKAYPDYKRAKFLFRPVLNKINLFCMQTEIDKQRIINLGARAEKVNVIGNLKFDQIRPSQNSNPPKLGLNLNERLIVAGSTHYPEEEILLRVFLKLKKHYSNIRLLIAPRHVHRTGNIQNMLKQEKIKCQLISQLNNPPGSDAIFVLDVMGGLDQIYKLADIVFVGGSLAKHGGQNPIEPAMFGKPIIFGKHMFNFSKITEMFLSNQAAVCVEDEGGLYEILMELLNHPDKIKILSRNAEALIKKNQGAAQKAIDLLKIHKILK
ncbi:MAG: 3-deoxy-D-manno-octulosonic acid transferase [Candidatus Omnitrophota bacterium]